MLNLTERSEKWDKTLSFKLDDVLNWRPDELRMQEIEDPKTNLTWIIQFRHIGEEDDTWLEFGFNFEDSVENIDEITIQYVFNLVDQKDPKKSDTVSTKRLPYTEIFKIKCPFEMILDPKNHYFSDNSVTVTFDFCIQSILYSDGISQLYFHGKPFDWKRKHLIGFMKKGEDDIHFIIEREIAAFHSPYFAKFPKGFPIIHIDPEFDFDLFEKCLQIMFGVQLQINPEEAQDLLKIAYAYYMNNVVRYIEMYSLQRCHSEGCRLSKAYIHVWNLRRLAKGEIRHNYENYEKIPKLKKVLEILVPDDGERCLPGETMKTWMEFFMSLT